MSAEVSGINRQVQAAHFDMNEPFTPVAWILRESGFDLNYILKDSLIAEILKTANPLPGQRVLDVGCGSGILLDRLSMEFGTEGIGVDISLGSLGNLKRESLSDLSPTLSDARALPFREDVFSLVVSLDVLEHIENPLAALHEMLRVVQPGGKILCYAVSSRTRLTFNWFLTKGFESLGIDHWSWKAHSPDLLVDPAEVVGALREAGFQVNSNLPFHAFFTILFDQLLLSAYWLAVRLGVFRKSRGKGNFERRILELATKVCRVLLKPLMQTDSPWVSRGLSNGFFILATKPDNQEVDIVSSTVWPSEAVRVAANG